MENEMMINNINLQYQNNTMFNLPDILRPYRIDMIKQLRSHRIEITKQYTMQQSSLYSTDIMNQLKIRETYSGKLLNNRLNVNILKNNFPNPSMEKISNKKNLVLRPTCFPESSICGHKIIYRNVNPQKHGTSGITIKPKTRPINIRLRT